MRDSLSIGDLAEATGVAVATLRAWESRHGFPIAQRDTHGRRRYSPELVPVVQDVVRRRAAGTQLGTAVTQAIAAVGPTEQAVYPELARQHPEQPHERLRKSTLLGLSWAIEDEVAARGERGHLFGSFQTGRSFAAARPRWRELARTALSTHVFAQFPDSVPSPDDGDDAITRIPLQSKDMMLREWTVVHDSPGLPVALVAWELPGQEDTPDRDRMFESVWTLDPRAVRLASQTCARVAAARGSTSATTLAEGPLAAPAGPDPDLQTVSRLTHRIVAYVEAAVRR